jgi:hypothetical protein
MNKFAILKFVKKCILELPTDTERNVREVMRLICIYTEAELKKLITPEQFKKD